MIDTITLPRSVVKQALEALNASMPHNNDMDHDWPGHIAARRALRAALEQPEVEQHPVAVVTGFYGGFPTIRPLEPATVLPAGMALYTHPQNLNCKSNQHRLATLWGYEKPQPPRQPLTDEQIKKLIPPWAAWKYEVGHDEAIKFARAIERAHGIGGEA